MGYAVLIASVVVQVLAALSAVYIGLLRPLRAWYWVAAAVGLMSVRRVFSLASAIYEKRSIDPGAELIALVISVVLLGGLLGLVRRYRLQQSGPVAGQLGIGSRRLGSVAITLGLLGLTISLVVAVLAYKASRVAIVESVKSNMMSFTRSLRDLALASMEPTEAPRQALTETCRRWKGLGRDELSGYLCIVRTDGVIALHMEAPVHVGKNVADMTIDVGENRSVSFRDLGDNPEGLVGKCIGIDGAWHIIAAVPVPELDAVICLHIPVGDIDADVFTGSLPWAVGFGLASFVLLPLSIVLLHRAYAGSQEELAASHVELREREERLRQIIQNMPVMMAALDDTGILVAWNGECERVTGYAASEIVRIPQAWEKLCPESTYRNQMLQEWRGSSEDFRDREWRVTCHDGTIKTIAWSNCSIAFPISGWSSWSIGVDVTQRKDAEFNARRSLAQLSRVARVSSLGEMATAIAHELNQPLTAISNYAQGGLRRLQSGATEVSEIESAMDRIAAQAHRAGDIIKRLRTFVSGNHFERVLSDMNEIVRTVVEMLDPETRMHKIEIVLDLSPLLPKIPVDRVQIQQVLVNLIQNGFDALRAGPAEPKRIEVTTSMTPDGYVQTTVRDTGCGLSDESLRFALDPFFTTKVDGLGMGLSISRSIVEAHQGELAVDPSCEQGARFQFRLPVTEGGDHA